MIILWNPINFLDGEGRWLIWEIAIISIALITSVLLSYFCKKTKKNSPSNAYTTPLFFLIWYYASLYSFDLVTDQLLSFSFSNIWITLKISGILITLSWILSRYTYIFLSYFLVLVLFAVSYDLWDAHMPALSALIAFCGLALTVASKETLSQVYSGLVLRNIYSNDEAIEISSHSIEGTISSIGWYQTTIQNNSQTITIPNSILAHTVVIKKYRKKII